MGVFLLFGNQLSESTYSLKITTDDTKNIIYRTHLHNSTATSTGKGTGEIEY